MLVAMATGTGKTKLAIALLYRLLNAKRFARVCFVVDRNALGQQTGGEFASTKVVGTKTFADIFDLKEIKEVTPEPETKVHICTIQGLVQRVLYANEPADVPPIDQYDLIVIDECHRGYLLDRELSDAELSFRGQEDYISKYRRVLEHFDAVKVGLTATPALHTVQIFGDPVFTYSYREAVWRASFGVRIGVLPLACERPPDGFRFLLQDDKKVLRDAARDTATLLPFLQSAHTEAKLPCEPHLAHMKLLPDTAHVDSFRDMHAIAFRPFPPLGERKGLLCTFDQSFSCFSHSACSCSFPPTVVRGA